MKHKMTIGLAVSFFVISGCLIIAALHFPETESRSMEVSTVSESTVKETDSDTERKDVVVSTEELTTAIMASKKKQDAAVVKKTASGEQKQSKEKKLTASESKTFDAEKKPSETAATSAEKNAEAAGNQTAEAQERTPVTTTEDPRRNEPTTSKPQSTEGERPKTTTEEKKPSTEATTEKSRVWHPEVTKEVWVVDEPAWSETVTYTDYIDCYLCPNCGATFATYDEAQQHIFDSVERYKRGEIEYNSICVNFRTWQTPIEKTETFDYPEQGHWETVVVSEGYWE